MPDYSRDAYSKALAKLTGYGSKIGSFHQGTYRTDIGVHAIGDGRVEYRSEIGGQGLGGGYCAGVCLDWIRRVLFSRPDRDSGYLTYHYEAIESGGAAHGHANADARERAFQTTGRLAQVYAERNKVLWTRPGGSAPDTPYKLKTDQFSSAAGGLDRAFDRSRTEAERETSKKRFSSLRIADSKRATYSTPGTWMHSLLNAGSPGTCTEAGFNRDGQSGHAVAFWRRRASSDCADSFYFFDPNYGVFSYKKGGLQQALQYLFWWDADDIPHYKNCASRTAQVMSYVLYGPPNLVGSDSITPPRIVESPPTISPPRSPAPRASPVSSSGVGSQPRQSTPVAPGIGVTGVRGLVAQWENTAKKDSA